MGTIHMMVSIDLSMSAGLLRRYLSCEISGTRGKPKALW
jgi:hypothetical protein